MNIYEDDFFYYIWKKPGVATTFGKQRSFLDDFITYQNEYKEIYDSLLHEFGVDKEFGLLNRLDNDTSGLLYFAKTQIIYDRYKDLQSDSKIYKTYIADVTGKFAYDVLEINHPIMHHAHISEKMAVIKNLKDMTKGRGELHQVSTYVTKLYYDDCTDSSTLLIHINKGIRHQIRAHLSSIGYPILGDGLYNKKTIDTDLHLYSIGLYIPDFR